MFNFHKLKQRLQKSNLTRALILVMMAMLLWLPVTTAQADIGPKPSMSFEFDYKIDKVAILEGKLMECDDEECMNWTALEELGPQHFTCEEYTCDSLAYGYSDYHKLVINFKDQERESNIFTKKSFSAKYKVTVYSTELKVEEVGGFSRLNLPCTASGGLTLVLETLLASIYLAVFGLPKHLLGWVPIASLVTLPFVWFVFPQLGLSAGLTTGMSESFAVAAETLFLYFTSGRSLPFRHAAALSLIMNAASFGLGWFIG